MTLSFVCSMLVPHAVRGRARKKCVSFWEASISWQYVSLRQRSPSSKSGMRSFLIATFILFGPHFTLILLLASSAPTNKKKDNITNWRTNTHTAASTLNEGRLYHSPDLEHLYALQGGLNLSGPTYMLWPTLHASHCLFVCLFVCLLLFSLFAV